MGRTFMGGFTREFETAWSQKNLAPYPAKSCQIGQPPKEVLGLAIGQLDQGLHELPLSPSSLSPLATITASYDQTYTLRSVVMSDTEGKEALRVSFFDLNKPHDILPYQKGEGLPEDYWEPTK
jgi:hypothetical protein